jgi:hypothetical protein
MYETGTALAAGSVRNLIGSQYRTRYVVVNNTAPSFTFSVTGNFL